MRARAPVARLEQSVADAPRQRRPHHGAVGEAVLRLQRTAGNAAVTAVLAGGPSRPGEARPVPVVQRDLVAFSEPVWGSTATGTERRSADAPGIRTALGGLITAGKVTVTSVGKEDRFATAGASVAEITAALTAAGYAKAPEMARALAHPHGATVYTGERLRRGKFSRTTTKERLEARDERALTSAEAAAARSVFGTALKLDAIVVHEGGIFTIGGYARVVHDDIYFPEGAFSGDLFPWLIHELTHVWQYQQGANIPGMVWEAVVGIYDYGGEAGVRKAWDDGQAFDDFTTEQQGDVLSDYFVRVRAGLDVTAYQGFVDQVRNGKATQRRYKTVEPLPGGTLDVGASYERHRAATEAAIVEQLRRRIRAGDDAAAGARHRTVLALFRELTPYWSATYRERILARRPDDELVGLLYARLGRRARQQIFLALGGSEPLPAR